MSGSRDIWRRLRESRVGGVLLVYLGVSWIVLQATATLLELLELPSWVGPVVLLLLGAGLVVVLATAWVQSSPATERHEAADAVPGSWEIEPAEAIESLRRGRIPHLTWARAIAGGVSAFVLLAGAVALYQVFNGRQAREARIESRVPNTACDGELALAVLPFRVPSSELKYLEEGMVNILSTNLEGPGGIRTIHPRTVLARWDEISGAGGGARPNHETVLEAVRTLGGRWALDGFVLASGERVEITAELYDACSAERLEQVRVQGPVDSIHRLADGLSLGVLRRLAGRSEAELASVDLARLTTPSVEALKAYLEGERHYRRSEYDAAAESYGRAIDADSTFAVAWLRRLGALGWSGRISGEEVRKFNEQYPRMEARLPAREALILRATVAWNTGFVVHAYADSVQAALRRAPEDAELWFTLGELYFHRHGALRIDRPTAAQIFERTVDLDPGFAIYHLHLVQLAFAEPWDTVTLDRRTRDLEEILPSGEVLDGLRLGHAMARGSRAARDSILDRLGDINDGTLREAISMLDEHPAFWNDLVPMLEEAATRSNPDLSDLAEQRLFARRMRYGRVRDALAGSRDVAIPDEDVVDQALARLAVRGIALPPGRADLALERFASRVDSARNQGYLAMLSFFAARKGRWDLFDAGLARTRDLVDDPVPFVDPADARRRHEMNVAAVRALGDWADGRHEAAAGVLRDAVAGVGVSAELADLLFEMERWEEAAGGYASVWADPWADYRLGIVYERLGEPLNARASYLRALAAWEGADAEWQPFVREIRTALARLQQELG